MLIDRYFDTGRTLLGSRYPILCGAMTWVSDAKLVAAVGRAGGFGILAGGNGSAADLRAEIDRTVALGEAPFGVNLITVAPNYGAQLNLVCDLGMPIVVFAGSFPKAEEIRRVKRAGGKAICFASTESLAMKLIDDGADALVLEGSEAGGHIGPVSLSVLLQQILFKVDSVPIFVAGGIATGRMMAHLLMMGAAGVQLGTRFVMSEECTAHPRFKEAFRKAKARDAIATPQFDSRLPVIPVRALKNGGSKKFAALQLDLMRWLDAGEIDRETAQHEVERFWMGALRRAVVDGDVDEGSLMAGQSVGLVGEVMPLRDIVSELVSEAEATLREIRDTLQAEPRGPLAEAPLPRNNIQTETAVGA